MVRRRSKSSKQDRESVGTRPANSESDGGKEREKTMSVRSERFVEIAERMGLKVEKQAAYTKISVGDKAVYFANTQKVTRVDVSGFSFQHPALKVLTAEEAKANKLGRVRGQLDFTKGEDAVIEAFTTALSLMRHLAGATAKELGTFNRFVKAVKPTVQVVEPRRKGVHSPVATA